MKSKSIGFLGAGRITGIFLQAFKNADMNFKNISVYDVNQEILSKLKARFPTIVVNNLEATASADIVMIALHPPVLIDVLGKINNTISKSTIVISLAPKVKTSAIANQLNDNHNIIRLIPNATSIINKGYNPVYFSETFDVNMKSDVMQLLSLLGYTFEVTENKLEAYAVASAMVPTYFWFQWKKLNEIAESFGLENAEAKDAVYHASLAALDTFYKSGLNANEVMDLIPVKPIGENEKEIESIYELKLQALYKKLSS